MPHTGSKSFACSPPSDFSQTYLSISTGATHPPINLGALPTHKKCTCITYIATHARASNPRIIAHPKHITPTKIKFVKLHAHIQHLNKHASPPSGCNYEQLAAHIPDRNLGLPSTYPTTRGEWVDIAIRGTGALLWNR